MSIKPWSPPSRSCRSKTPWWHPVSVILLAVVCYYPSLECGLVFDDIAAIRDNKDVREQTPLWHIFLHDFWGTPIHKEHSHKSYRPLTVLTFRWNYSLHELEAMGYHFVNLFLHTIVSLLFLRLCRLFLHRNASFLASLLFAVHPIHTDAVASVVGRAELLSALFFLSALLTYCGKPNDDEKIDWLKMVATILLSWVGTLCKEQALTVLIVCGIYDIIIRYQVLHKKQLISILLIDKRKAPPWVKYLIVRLILLIGAFSVALVARIKIMGTHFPTFSRFDNPSSAAETPTRQLTFNYLVVFNAWLLLFPCDLCCDWTSESLPLVKSFLDLRNIVTVALYFSLIGFIHHVIVKALNNALMFMALTMVTFLPATNLFFPLGFVVAERVLYIPSMGFCMLIALGWSRLQDKKDIRNIGRTAVVILLILYGIRTIYRCRDWKDEYSLYKSGLKVNPRNVKLLNNLGRILERMDRPHEALKYYQQAVTVQPENVATFLNLGNSYARMGYIKDAERTYQKARELLPQPVPGRTYEAHVTLFHLQALLKLASLIAKNISRTEEAERLYSQVVNMRADYKMAYTSWGNLMLRTNKRQEARIMLQRALEQEENDPDMLYNLGVVICEQGKPGDALAFFNRALDLNPHHEASLLASARIIQEEGIQELQDVALKRFQKLVELGHADETIYFNMGMLAIKSGDRRNAEIWLQQAIKLKHNFSEALYNMALLLYREQRPLEAAVFLRSLLQKENHIQGLLLLADIHLSHVKDLKTAEMLYEKVLMLDPQNYQGLHNLCVVYVERRFLERAVECFARAKELAPHVPYIQHHLEVASSMLEMQRNGNKVNKSPSLSTIEDVR